MAVKPKGPARAKRTPVAPPVPVAVAPASPHKRAKRKAVARVPAAPATPVLPVAAAPVAAPPVAPAAARSVPSVVLRRPGPVRRIAGAVRRHPVASIVTVLAAGVAVTLLVRSRSRWVPALAALPRALPRALPPLRLPDLGLLIDQLKPQFSPVARRIGVAGVKVSADLGGGGHRKFGASWRRRAADGAEDDWPIDEVELESRRADGGRTGFEFKWKTLPTDSPPDPAPRYPGDSPLGETSLELETKQPDGRKTGMAFTWRKLPARGRPPDGTPEQGK